jgi:excisionase family DNA binding protein
MSNLKEDIDPIDFIRSFPSTTSEELEALELENNCIEEADRELIKGIYIMASEDEKQMIDYANSKAEFSRSAFDKFRDQVLQRKEKYRTDIKVLSYNEPEKTNYLQSEFESVVKEISRCDVGRDYLLNESPQRFIDLFDTSNDSKYISADSVINLSEPRENYGIKRKRLINNLIPYQALNELLSEIPNTGKASKFQPANQPNREFYDLPEAAIYLGIGKSTLSKALKEEKIFGSKVGRIWRFTKADLDKYIVRVKSTSEINSEVEKAILSRKQKRK